MGYSFQLEPSYHRYQHEFGARVDYAAYRELFQARVDGHKIRMPRGIESEFMAGGTTPEREIATLIQQYRTEETLRLAKVLVAQRKRLDVAEASLSVKPTRGALESRRIAARKIEATLAALSDLKRSRHEGDDTRVFPGSYAHVVVVDNGERVVRPMRYGCRPAGKPQLFDLSYPGAYAAHQDDLQVFWKGQFGYHHGVTLWWRFFDHVDRDGDDVLLEFTPAMGEVMTVACLYAYWRAPAGSDARDLWSFAAVMGDPPLEVAAAGNDRCVLALRPADVETWLHPDAGDLAVQRAVLDRRERYYYEHRVAS